MRFPRKILFWRYIVAKYSMGVQQFGFYFRADAFVKWNLKTATQWLKKNNLYFWSKKTHDAFSPHFHQWVIVTFFVGHNAL